MYMGVRERKIAVAAVLLIQSTRNNRKTFFIFGFSQTTAKIIKDDVGVRFKNVAGCEDAKLEIIDKHLFVAGNDTMAEYAV